MNRRYLFATITILIIITLNLSGCLNPFGSSQSVIYGTVSDNNGNAVPGAQVKAAVLERTDSTADWKDVSETVSDSDGHYRLYITSGFKPLKLTANKAGLIDASVQFPSTEDASSIVDLALKGATNLSAPRVDPLSAVSSQNVPIDIYVLATGTKAPDKVTLRAQCFDSKGDIVQSFSMVPMPAETSLPAYYVNESAFDSSLFSKGTYTLVFTGCDDDGNRTNQVSTTFTIVEG